MSGWDNSVLQGTLVPLLDGADRANVARCCKAWRTAFAAGLQELQGVKSVQALPFVARCSNLRLLDLHAASPLPPSAGSGCGSFVACMRQLTALEELRCQTSESLIFYNRAICLDERELAALSHLTALRVLDLSNQPALGRKPQLAFLHPLTRLTRLSLAGDFTLSPSAYAAINALGGQLLALDLRGKASSAVELGRLSGLVGLQELDCSQCSVELAPADAAALLQLPSLRTLKLASSSAIATDALLAQLPGCSSLEALDISGCTNLTDQGGLCHLAAVPRLRSLNCSYCQHNVSSAGLEGATRLRVLELQGCQSLCYSAMWRFLRACTGLASLNLATTTLSLDDPSLAAAVLCSSQLQQHAQDNSVSQSSKSSMPWLALLQGGAALQSVDLSGVRVHVVAEEAAVRQHIKLAADGCPQSSAPEQQSVAALLRALAVAEGREIKPSRDSLLQRLLGTNMALRVFRWQDCELQDVTGWCTLLGAQTQLQELVLTAAASGTRARSSKLSVPQQQGHHVALHASLMQAAVNMAWQHTAAFAAAAAPGASASAMANAPLEFQLAQLRPLKQLTRLECDAPAMRQGMIPILANCIVHLTYRYPQLHSLRMRQFDWRRVEAHEVASLSNLVHLDIAYSMDFGSMQHIQGLQQCTGLQSLVLDVCAAASQAFDGMLSALRQLHTLSLKGCTAFQDGNMPTLLQLRRLRTLNVQACSVTPDALCTLSSLDALATLSADEQQLSPAALTSLGRCQSLRHLLLGGVGRCQHLPYEDLLPPWVVVR